MRVLCRVSWTVFSESIARLQAPGSHSPLNIHLEKADSSRAAGALYRLLYTAVALAKNQNQALAIPLAELCNTLKHSSVSNHETARLQPSEPISQPALFSLICKKQFKPSCEIRHWPITCSFHDVCILAPFEAFAGARCTCGREPRPHRSLSQPAPGCDVTASQPTLPKPGPTARFHFFL